MKSIIRKAGKMILVLSVALLLLPSCGSEDAKEVMNIEEGAEEGEKYNKSAAGKKHNKRRKVNVEEFEAAGVNELNSVPILMYHRIYNQKNKDTKYTGGNVDKDGYNRTAEALEADLEFYYTEGYRAIRLSDYVEGYIDVEFGKSPVILTFDDGDENAVVTGFEDDGTPIFKTNCALDVLERFKKKHPDFNMTATFFLNAGLFRNGDEIDAKVMKWMVDNGYDIGNHTRDHAQLGYCNADEIEYQVGWMYKKLDEIIPGQYVDIVALPFGSPAQMNGEPQYEKVFAGNYEGHAYTSRASLLCGWTRAFSPFVTEYDKTCIRRIRAYDNNGKDFDIQFNFEELKGRRYISDGDPSTIVIREEEEEGWLGETYGREVIRY